MNLQNFRTICGYHHTVIDSVRTACLKCVPSCLRRHHQVLPIHLHYDNCEFLQLHPQRRIRVIHYNSQDDSDATDSNTNANAAETEVSNVHESGLDDYWFVRGSHSSYRLFKKKSREISSNSETSTRHSKLLGSPLEGIRYSFHKKEKLKPCIEEEVTLEPAKNQTKTLDSVISNLVSVIIEEAITIVVHEKHQRSHNNKTSENTSLECLPQRNNTTLVNSKILQNGIKQVKTDELSGCNNVAFVSDVVATQVSTSKDADKSTTSKSEAKTNDTLPSKSQDQGDKKEAKKNQPKKSNSKQPSKPLLLFLHGAGGSAEEWSSLLIYFAGAGYEIVAPDLLGHGLSSAPHAPKAYTFACLLQDALQIFDTFAPEPRKCVVIGHGYGCSFAAAVARYRPQSVVQLVLISGGGPTPLAPNRGIYSLPRFLLGCAKPLLLCGFRREYFYAARGKQLMFGDHLHIPSYVWSYMCQGQVWPQGDTAFHRRISVPTLLVHGLQDPHITLVEECEMERTIPRSFLEIVPGAGHKAMIDAPEPLSHMLHCFITLWDKSGALSK